MTIVRDLVPHEWFWDAVEVGTRDARRGRHIEALPWETAFAPEHVQALLMWVLAHLVVTHRGRGSRSQTSFALSFDDAAALLGVIETKLWPGNFYVLLAARYFMDDLEAQEELLHLFRRWLEMDPVAFWALREITSVYYDRDGLPLRIMAPEEVHAVLARAYGAVQPLATTSEGESLGEWIHHKLSVLREEKWG